MSENITVRPERWTPRGLLGWGLTRLGVVGYRARGHYGFRLVRRRASWLIRDVRLVARGHGWSMLFPACDEYTADMFLGGVYEPELHAVFAALGDTEYSFVDAGANIGYWSVVLSRAGERRRAIIAVEASLQTVGLLAANLAEIEQSRAIHAAIHRAPGTLVAIDEDVPHAARSVAARSGSVGGGVEVVTVSIDELVAQFAPPTGAIIVKLDVEGVEPDAIVGTSRTIAERDTIFLAEDHGHDASHATCHGLLDAGMLVWFLKADGSAIPVDSDESIAAHKVDSGIGYNVLGHRPGSEAAAGIGLDASTHSAGTVVRLSATRSVQ